MALLPFFFCFCSGGGSYLEMCFDRLSLWFLKFASVVGDVVRVVSLMVVKSFVMHSPPQISLHIPMYVDVKVPTQVTVKVFKKRKRYKEEDTKQGQQIYDEHFISLIGDDIISGFDP